MAYRDFRYLWMGQTSHAFAIWIDMISQPLLILSLTGSPVHLGLVLMARTLPGLALAPLSGAVADSFNRRVVLLTTKVVVLALTLAFVSLLVLDAYGLWTVYAYSALRGATMAFDMPARRAMIPSIVPKHLVTNAMALSTGSMQASRIAGAAGAGLLVAFWGFEGAYVIVALMYVGAVYFTWKLRPLEHKRDGYQGMRSMGGDMAEGLRFVWRTPILRAVLIFALGYFTFGMAFMQVFAPLFAKREEIFNIGDAGFGFMMMASGMGATLGALVLAAANPSKHRGLIMIGMLAAFGLLLLAFSASAQLNSVVLGFVVIFLLGIGQSNFHPLMNAVAVEAAPENMRGRVIGLLNLDRATTTLGGALAGLLAATLNPVAAQALFGIACVGTALAMFAAYPTLRKID